MSIPVRCQCGKAFAARDELAGKRVKCPACGGVLPIPSPPALAPLDDDPLGLGGVDLSAAGLGSGPAPAGTARPRAPLGKTPSRGAATSDNRTLLFICAGVGGGVVLLLLALLVGSMLFSSSEDKPVAETPPQPAASAPTPTGSPSAPTPATDSAGPAAAPAPTAPAPESPSPAPAPAASTAEPPAAKETPAPPAPPAGVAASPTPAPPDPAEGKWQVQPDAPETPVDWPDKMPVNVPVPYGGDTVLYPATPSPFAVIGLNITGGKDVQLWNLLTQKKAGRLQDAVESGNPVALSSDGRYMALKSRDSKRPTTLELWSFQAGKKEREIECDEAKLRLDMFEFLGPGRLVTYTSGFAAQGVRHCLRFWDAATGNQLHELVLSDSLRRENTAVSSGGRYLAVMGGRDQLAMYDSTTGKLAGELAVGDALGAATGVFEGMSFSPDGKQLGLVYADTNSRLVLLDLASGTIADTVELAGKSPLASAYRGATVEWLGDKAWCLFGGTIVDRTTRRVVWNLSLPILDRLTARRTLAGGWILSTTGAQNRKTVRFIPIPWPKIDASLAAMQEDAAPHLKPGMSVSLNIRVDKLRFGDPGETATKLADIFRQRFERDTITVADDQPIVLNVLYGESVGETLVERQGISGPATGRTVQATNVNVKMELKKRTGGPALWQHEFAYSPMGVTIIGQQATDATAPTPSCGICCSSSRQRPSPISFRPASRSALCPE